MTTQNKIKDIYTDKYVVFLDILGFKNKVNDAEKNPETRQELLDILDILRDTLCNSDEYGMQFTHFSDCIIFSENRTIQGLLSILKSINMITLNLLNYDFFVRGGLTVGGIHHDSSFVYGSAVNKAYEIESKKAIFPMTLLCNEVIADAKTYGLPIEEHLINDAAKNHYFVHYLKSYADYEPLTKYAGKVILDSSGRRIIDFICHRLNTHSDRILEKDIWFQNYWNDKVAVKGVFGRIEAGVTERDSNHGATIIVRRFSG